MCDPQAWIKHYVKMDRLFEQEINVADHVAARGLLLWLHLVPKCLTVGRDKIHCKMCSNVATEGAISNDIYPETWIELPSAAPVDVKWKQRPGP